MLYPTMVLLGALVAAGPGQQAMRQAQEHAQAGAEKMQEGAWNDAIAELRKAVELDPGMAMAHFNLGHCHMALKQHAEAEADYRASVQAILSSASLTQEDLARRRALINDEINALQAILRGRGMGGMRSGTDDLRKIALEERIRVLEESRPTAAGSVTVPAEIHVALGGACLRQGKLAEAEQAFLDAIAVNPKQGAAHNNLAVVYMLTQRFEEARAAVKSAEKAGFRVSPAFKKDLKEREKAAKAVGGTP